MTASIRQRTWYNALQYSFISLTIRVLLLRVQVQFCLSSFWGRLINSKTLKVMSSYNWLEHTVTKRCVFDSILETVIVFLMCKKRCTIKSVSTTKKPIVWFSSADCQSERLTPKNHLTLLLRWNTASDIRLTSLLYHAQNPMAFNGYTKSNLFLI